jgi:hypothetical protein
MATPSEDYVLLLMNQHKMSSSAFYFPQSFLSSRVVKEDSAIKQRGSYTDNHYCSACCHNTHPASSHPQLTSKYTHFLFAKWMTVGPRGIIVGWGTMFHSWRSRVRFRMRSSDFSVDLILPPMRSTQPLNEMSTRNLPGVECGLSTLKTWQFHRRLWADCLENVWT